jgi:hypothetical protein
VPDGSGRCDTKNGSSRRIPHERGDKRMAKKAAKGGKKKGGKKR